VVIEATTNAPLGLKFAVCLDGENACPPEDCGGVNGYSMLLEALADPDHEDHEHRLSWMGGSFDPAAFAVAEANIALQRVPR
jgi:hypothetical protein